jgi:hypothetical protein
MPQSPEHISERVVQLEREVVELKEQIRQKDEEIRQKDEVHKQEVNKLFYIIGELTIKINQINNGQSPVPGRVTESQEKNLRRIVVDSFSLEEFRIVLNDAGVPLSEIDDKKPFSNYVQDALDYCQRRWITLNLIEVLKKERPHIDWYGTK